MLTSLLSNNVAAKGAQRCTELNNEWLTNVNSISVQKGAQEGYARTGSISRFRAGRFTSRMLARLLRCHGTMSRAGSPAAVARQAAAVL